MTQSSPWDNYPFRQTPATSLAGTPVSAPGSAGSGISGMSSKLGGASVPLRDATLSPSARGVGANNGSFLGTRGSIPTVGQLGSISSRASIASIGSLSSADTTSVAGSDSSVNVWHSSGSSSGGLEDKAAAAAATATAISSKSSTTPTANAVVPASTLVVTGLPREISVRECNYIFALALDFASLDVSKNAVSGEVSINAKFGSVQSAQQAAHILERRIDLFGPEMKTQVQAYAPQYVSHPSAARSLYSSARPFYGESYWSQQPSTPISPSTGTEFFNSSRRQSAISPTEVYTSAAATAPLSQLNLSGATYADTSASSSPSHVSGSGAPSPLSTPTSATVGMSAVGSGLPGTPTLAQSLTKSSSSSSVQLSPTHTHHQPQQPALQQGANPPQGQNHHHHHNQHTDSQKLPPPNPADQNPPCNTLYVGNLPPDTSEVELKDIFSQQKGYRRLCFRTKQNGPMCFVEFEDEVLAGKALASLYGYILSNSVKGGIRLSYSKNPLGVRSRPLRK